MKRSYGVPELLDELRRVSFPSYGLADAAKWHAHRAECIARALGISLDDMPSELTTLLAHAVPTPGDGALEYSLFESRFEGALGPVRAAWRALEELYRAERLRLAHEAWGARAPVDEEALFRAGLDAAREPNRSSLIDQL